jgi:hypothetical protein
VALEPVQGWLIVERFQWNKNIIKTIMNIPRPALQIFLKQQLTLQRRKLVRSALPPIFKPV